MGLAGAQFGRVRPWREIEGGIWLINRQTSQLENRPAAIRIVSRSVRALCDDYARQYLEGRGDKRYLDGQIGEQASFFRALYALIEVPKDAEGALRPLFTVPSTLADANGKLSAAVVPLLPTKDLDFADGQLARISREYALLAAEQTPDRFLTAEEWEAIVTEGKEQPLKTLHSRYGSSRLIQALHGLTAGWPE
jgi:hypothetical protein